jgi:hypothetical protein
MQGYVTGVSYAFETTKKLRLHFPQTVRDSDGLSSWLDVFCQAHADKDFDAAGQWLVNDIWSSSSTSAIESIVQEGIDKANQAKTAVSEAYLLNGGMAAVRSLAARWTFSPTEYVSNISVSPINGTVTITYSARAPEISGATITFTPQAKVGNSFKLLNAISADQVNMLDWACSSSTNLSTLKNGSVPRTLELWASNPPIGSEDPSVKNNSRSRSGYIRLQSSSGPQGHLYAVDWPLSSRVVTLQKWSYRATNALSHEADIGKLREWLGPGNVSTTRFYDRRKTRSKDSPTFHVKY